MATVTSEKKHSRDETWGDKREMALSILRRHGDVGHAGLDHLLKKEYGVSVGFSYLDKIRKEFREMPSDTKYPETFANTTGTDTPSVVGNGSFEIGFALPDDKFSVDEIQAVVEFARANGGIGRVSKIAQALATAGVE